MGDSESWERGSLSAAGSELYAGDHEDEIVQSEQVKLRVLHEKDAAPVELTVAVLKDKIIIKLDDARTVSCSTSGEEPVIVEGKRPELVLEAVDNEPAVGSAFDTHEPNPPARAGSGLSWRMMTTEARRLLRGKGKRFFTTWLFLAAMSVLTTFIVSDYVTVSSVDPHDFVITDSHILELSFERGAMLGASETSVISPVTDFLNVLNDSGLDFDMLPPVSSAMNYSTDIFVQMGTVSQNFSGFSHALIDRLDESKLIYGRMPERSDEIVVDRWVLDDFLAKDGILPSSIPGITDFLGVQLHFNKLTYAPTIVGICDCGDPTIYLTKTGYASIGRGGKPVITLSELQTQFPEEYDAADLINIISSTDSCTISSNQCIVITNNAGAIYRGRVGQSYKISSKYSPRIKATIEADIWAWVVIPDEKLDFLLYDMSRASDKILLYCADKQAVKDFIAEYSTAGQLIVEVKDAHGTSMAKYKAASNLKADARTIVTVTIIVLCMVMLYLLQRASVQERIGMMAVYRLLGIPGHKLVAIFSVESLLFSLSSVLPATALTWLVIQIMNRLPSLEFSMLLPVSVAAAVFAAIAAYYLLVSLLPVQNLLRLPPARLAGKYDL